MAKPVTVSIRLNDADIKGILRAFSKMDKEASTRLKDLSKEIATDVAQELRGSARSAPWYPAQATAVAASIRVNRDRTPSVSLGGNRIHTTSDGRRVPTGSLVFGSEFGSTPSKQRDSFRNLAQAGADAQGGLRFGPRSPKEGRGNRGYWIFPRLKRLQPDILRRWVQGAQEVADYWTKA